MRANVSVDSYFQILLCKIQLRLDYVSKILVGVVKIASGISDV